MTKVTRYTIKNNTSQNVQETKENTNLIKPRKKINVGDTVIINYECGEHLY